MPAAVPSLRQTSSPCSGSKAAKRRRPSTHGQLLRERGGRRPARCRAPAACRGPLPSLHHSSCPRTPPSAAKKTPAPCAVSQAGLAAGRAGPQVAHHARAGGGAVAHPELGAVDGVVGDEEEPAAGGGEAARARSVGRRAVLGERDVEDGSQGQGPGGGAVAAPELRGASAGCRDRRRGCRRRASRRPRRARRTTSQPPAQGSSNSRAVPAGVPSLRQRPVRRGSRGRPPATARTRGVGGARGPCWKSASPRATSASGDGAGGGGVAAPEAHHPLVFGLVLDRREEEDEGRRRRAGSTTPRPSCRRTGSPGDARASARARRRPRRAAASPVRPRRTGPSADPSGSGLGVARSATSAVPARVPSLRQSSRPCGAVVGGEEEGAAQRRAGPAATTSGRRCGGRRRGAVPAAVPSLRHSSSPGPQSSR